MKNETPDQIPDTEINRKPHWTETEFAETIADGIYWFLMLSGFALVGLVTGMFHK